LETTNKKSVQLLIDTVWRKGLTRIVISPGSRNAPLILGFSSHPKYTCYSVPDERAAGFIALGMAHQTNSPVALVCSSGSALLNYYPSIAEAFYRKIPLVVLSADRPERLIDQGDGQTIRQNNVFANHILFSSQLAEFPSSDIEIELNRKSLYIALLKAIPSPTEKGGPVHLNIPFEEPLYETEQLQSEPFTDSGLVKPTSNIDKSDIKKVAQLWNSSRNIIILVGQKDVNPVLDKHLIQLSKNAVILCETTSNISVPNSINCIDRLITPFNEEDRSKFKCDLLITLGDNIVSKRIKAILRKDKPQNHFHIEVTDMAPDTYQCLTQHLAGTENEFFENLIPRIHIQDQEYVSYWSTINTHRKEQQIEFVNSATFSDFKVMSYLNRHIPSASILHLANSTSVRYAQLFDWSQELTFHANRGTSGIDGIVSTAMGTAITTDKIVYLIVGDISFFYDTNAWWHRHVPSNLKVIVINNNGGGIFRLIDGPHSTGQLENHFETHQKNSVKHIALGFGVDYFCATNLIQFQTKFEELSTLKNPGILEVITPQAENAGILKDYFKSFNN
jgi:2-succinyl-5-enolpyruvyl-6-hydroxy-3-cyclohexene-1-carboxylate synthase